MTCYVKTSMTSPVKVLGALGTLMTLIALLSVVPDLWAMNANLGNPNYPATEVATNSITNVVYALVPTTGIGLFLYVMGELQ